MTGDVEFTLLKKLLFSMKVSGNNI